MIWLSLARIFGKPLMETAASITYREFLLWRRFLQEPSLTDLYLMQVACEVRRSYVRKPRQVQLQHFKLMFRDEEVPQDLETVKQMWLKAVGKRDAQTSR